METILKIIPGINCLVTMSQSRVVGLLWISLGESVHEEAGREGAKGWM